MIVFIAFCVLLLPGHATAASPTPGPTPAPGSVWINEFLPNPAGADTDREWIELKNAGQVPVMLDGVKVKRENGSALVTVPAGTTLAPGGYLLLDDLSGSIVNGGDTLGLWSGETRIDGVTYDDGGEDDWSWARLAASEGAWTDRPTPGAANPSRIDVPGSDAPASEAGTRAGASASNAAYRGARSNAVTASKLPSSGFPPWPYAAVPGLLAMLYAYRTLRNP